MVNLVHNDVTLTHVRNLVLRQSEARLKILIGAFSLVSPLIFSSNLLKRKENGSR